MTAAERPRLLSAGLLALALLPSPVLAQRWDVGLSGKGIVIEALSRANAVDGAPTVLLVGGLDGDEASARQVREALASNAGPGLRLVGIPLANPDAGAVAFPPSGVAYREHRESHALWRWIGVHAPDMVIVIGADHGLARALSENEVAGVGRIPAR